MQLPREVVYHGAPERPNIFSCQEAAVLAGLTFSLGVPLPSGSSAFPRKFGAISKVDLEGDTVQVQKEVEKVNLTKGSSILLSCPLGGSSKPMASPGNEFAI